MWLVVKHAGVAFWGGEPLRPETRRRMGNCGWGGVRGRREPPSDTKIRGGLENPSRLSQNKGGDGMKPSDTK